MNNPIRAALDKAACAICICEGECFETRHGMMHGPCEKLTGEAANAIAAFLRALPTTDPTFFAQLHALADAVLGAAKEEPSSDT
jgi:hypothetical protein